MNYLRFPEPVRRALNPPGHQTNVSWETYMHRLDSHHFMPAYLCFHRPQCRTAIRHSFCSTLFDSLMDLQIEFGRSCRSGRAADTSWYRQMAETLAHDMEACDGQAAAIINGESPAVYAANMNYGTFDVESVATLDTSYTLVGADTSRTWSSSSRTSCRRCP